MYDFQEILEKGPYLIVVSGAPGSGKTTLAKKLAERLWMVHLERDALTEHIYQLNKSNPNYSKGAVGIKRAYDLVGSMLESQISIVMDATLYKGKSEQDIAKFKKYATLVNIHCNAGNLSELKKRFRKREIGIDGSKPDWLDDHMDVLDEIYEDVVNPLELGCQLIEVQTSKEYDPPIEKILDMIKDAKTIEL